MADERTDRWQHLVSGAFSLDDRPDADVVQTLESVLEVFPAGIDPLEDFEGYAVRRFAQALLARWEKR